MFLEPGDVIVGFTDGIPEARKGKETFGTEAVSRLLEESAFQPAGTIAERVMDAARAFAGGTLGDDAVVVVVRAVETDQADQDEERSDG
jgi:serine phosphatase RsbU (regulator of sigma subunit)